MAAHVKTALEQIIENPAANAKFIPAALNVSCWSEDLDLSDYCELADLVEGGLSAENLKAWAEKHYQKYAQKWLNCGMPKTREAWHKAWQSSLK